MLPKWTTTLVVIVLITLSEEVSSNFRCIDTDQCSCVHSIGNYEFSCPPYFEEQGVVVKLEERQQLENREWKLRIDCFNFTDYVQFLPNAIVGNVTYLRIQSCPLPENGYKYILDQFNISSLQYLQHDLYDLSGITLNNQYFKHLETVTFLVLNSNELVNIEPTFFSNFPNLESLNLQDNNLTLTSDLLMYLPKLRRLDLSKNSINIIPKGLFKSLNKLEVLEMWSNKITELNEESFEGLDSLVALELSFNKIEFIHENTLSNLTQLNLISLVYNNLSLVPQNLFLKNKNLKLVKLSYNNHLELSNKLFSNLLLLEEIDLRNSNIKQIPKDLFDGSTNIKNVVLSFNELEEIPDELFKDLRQLKTLDIQSNKIKNINDNVFTDLGKLEVLNLSDNLLEELTANTFRNLRSLLKIYLDRNLIKKIDNLAFQYVTGLKILSMPQNKYEMELFFGSTPFNPLQNIEELNLSHNSLRDINFQEFVVSKQHMKILDVSFNNITEIQVDDFIPVYPQFKLLVDLSNNDITSVTFSRFIVELLPDASKIDALHPGSSITQIQLSDNPIRCDCAALDLVKYFKGNLDPRIRTLVELKSDNLVCKSPSDFEDINIEDFPLKALTCPYEEVFSKTCSDICNCMWRAVDTAVIVDCKGRNLTSLPDITIEDHKSTLELDFDNNNLKHFPDKYGKFNITKLLLSNNFLENVTWVPKHVEVLQLHNNQINRLDQDVLEALYNNIKLTNLTLHNNPWVCDCEAKNLTDFLRLEFEKIDSSKVRCVKDNKTLVSLNEKYLCHTNDSPLLVSVATVSIALFMGASICALYLRYSKEIKIWLYARNLCLWLIEEEDLDSDKTYDAFVSYSHKDEDFVQNIVDKLEGGPQPYRLCLHMRDWYPGESIPAHIVNSVDQSKRTLIILSNNFLESVWAQMEFQTAHIQSMKERRSRVIIVLYEEVNQDALDEDLKIYLKTNTYVKWGEKYFWDKLMFALPHNKRQHSNAQKHANIMMSIDDRFVAIKQPHKNESDVSQLVTLDADLLSEHPLNLKNQEKNQNTIEVDSNRLYISNSC